MIPVIRTGLLLALLFAQLVPFVASGDAVPVSPIGVNGLVDHWIYSSAGKADGLVLQDHTFISFHSEALADPGILRYGDKVLVQGTQVLVRPNRVLDRVRIFKNKQLVLNDSSPPQIQPAPVLQPDARYFTLVDAGRLFAVGARGDGEVDRLIFQNGTVIFVPPGGYVDPEKLQLGQPISTRGYGTTVGTQKYIHALNIQRPDQSTLISARVSGPREIWGVKVGAFRQPLITPDGQMDGILLDDNSAIRFAPVPIDLLASLNKGMQIEAAGPTYSNQLRTSALFLQQQQKVLNLQPQAIRVVATQQAGTVAQSLNPLEDVGRVQSILRGPEGKVESLVLDDGATVQLPPRLQSDLSQGLTVGDVVEVKGRGGSYVRGTALIATSVRKGGYSANPSSVFSYSLRPTS